MRCKEDNKEFNPIQPHQKYCSEKCKERVHKRKQYRNNIEYRNRQIEKGKLGRLKAIREGKCHRCFSILPEGCGVICPECREKLERNKWR